MTDGADCDFDGNDDRVDSDCENGDEGAECDADDNDDEGVDSRLQ